MEEMNGTSDDDWIFDPSLAAMNRRLQKEIREEAEEVESIVQESELRERSIKDVAREAGNRADFVTLSTAVRSFSGRITFAGKDFVTLRTESFEVDLNVDCLAYMRTVEKGRLGGRPIGDGPGTFEMRLVERKSPHTKVEIGYRSLEQTVIGRIMTVGQDHLVMIDDQRTEWTIPIGSIAYVLRRDKGPAR